MVSDYFFASLPETGMVFLNTVIDAVPNLSVITQIELLCWQTDAITEQHVKNFIADSSILNITPDVIAHCVTLRKSKKMKTPDAITAATALANGFVVIIANEKDFINIKGLAIVNPHKL